MKYFINSFNHFIIVSDPSEVMLCFNWIKCFLPLLIYFVYYRLSHCSMTISAEHRSEFAALHRSWWRLYIRVKNSRVGRKATNKQTNKIIGARCVRIALKQYTIANLFWFWNIELEAWSLYLFSPWMISVTLVPVIYNEPLVC